ncbi:hypothetical protein V1478_017091 [Vespula squamosa]|uniref:Uncharacterized protein n=1 Tax=Vespula squamosa TaxID=30214 RepID=A0ABD1ZYJ2_VESSQ
MCMILRKRSKSEAKERDTCSVRDGEARTHREGTWTKENKKFGSKKKEEEEEEEEEFLIPNPPGVIISKSLFILRSDISIVQNLSMNERVYEPSSSMISDVSMNERNTNIVHQ